MVVVARTAHSGRPQRLATPCNSTSHMPRQTTFSPRRDLFTATAVWHAGRQPNRAITQQGAGFGLWLPPPSRQQHCRTGPPSHARPAGPAPAPSACCAIEGYGSCAAQRPPQPQRRQQRCWLRPRRSWAPGPGTRLSAHGMAARCSRGHRGETPAATATVQRARRLLGCCMQVVQVVAWVHATDCATVINHLASAGSRRFFAACKHRRRVPVRTRQDTQGRPARLAPRISAAGLSPTA